MGQYSPCDVDDLNKEILEGNDDFLEFLSSNVQAWKRINLNAFISKL